MGLFNRKKKELDLSIQMSSNSSKEYARVIEWKPQWDTGAPMPQVFSNGHKTYLIYLINEPDPNWDGTYSTRIDNSSDNHYSLALIEFNGGTFRFGTVNDEAANGHPLYGKGLDFYSAHLVENSKWINELKNIHRVHPRFDEKHWINEKHFLLFFHDEMFEIIASDFKVETFRATFKDLAKEVVERMNK